MDRSGLLAIVAEQRGTALPLAMIMLVLLTSLTTAFIAMSATEPTIATNLKTGDQAFALAEAGVERARWALNNSGAPASGLTSPLPVPVPAPYAGTLVALGAGAYQVTVANGAPNEVNITSIGTVLRSGAALPGAPPIPQADIAAQRVVQVTFQTAPGISPGNTANNLPGALSVGGSVQASGNTSIAGGSTTCGAKTGVTKSDYPAACPSCPANTISTSGNASITGSPSGTGTISNSVFAQSTFSSADLAALKALAQSSGTYIQPTSSSISLGSGNQTINGLIFVDTINGQAFSGGSPSDPYSNFNSSTDASKLVTATISGNTTGNGWIIVMGTLQTSGNTSYNGLLYTYNDFQASGNTNISGALVSKNAVDSIATVIDTQTSGNSSISFNCSAVATGGGYLPSSMSAGSTFSLKTGTWKACPVGAC